MVRVVQGAAVALVLLAVRAWHLVRQGKTAAAEAMVVLGEPVAAAGLVAGRGCCFRSARAAQGLEVWAVTVGMPVWAAMAAMVPPAMP